MKTTNDTTHIAVGNSLRNLLKQLKLEVVYRNMQDLVDHSSREAKFNRREMLCILKFKGCYGLGVCRIDIDKLKSTGRRNKLCG